jgi:dynactin complex subunit
MMRQKSSTPKLRKDNRLSYIDNEIKVLDAEQVEVDKQLAILERRLRETSEEDDATLYDALLQQFLTLVNKKNALMKRQFQVKGRLVSVSYFYTFLSAEHAGERGGS